MKETTAQNLLAANAGKRRVTIGLNSPEELRSLSDARTLTCPACGTRLNTSIRPVYWIRKQES